MKKFSDNDLLVQSRFKNLRMWELMAGRSNVECSRSIGVSQQEFGRLLNLKRSPFCRDEGLASRQYTRLAEKIADFFGTSPDFLFPERLYSLALPDVVERKYSSIELLPLLSARSIPALSGNPEDHVNTSELGGIIDSQLETLSPREARVIRLRFGLEDGREHTLEDAGKIFGVSRDRVRQIEARALTKLRHPSRGKSFIGALDKDERDEYTKRHILVLSRNKPQAVGQ